MRKQEAEKLAKALGDVVMQFAEKGDARDAALGAATSTPVVRTGADTVRPVERATPRDPALDAKDTADVAAELKLSPDQVDKLYRLFKRRMIDDAAQDPILLHLITVRPEIILELQPREVSIDGSSLRGRVARLISAGWFDSGRRQGECRTELTRTGSEPNSGQLSTLFGEFVRDGFLERTSGDRYTKGAGVKITEKVLRTH